MIRFQDAARYLTCLSIMPDGSPRLIHIAVKRRILVTLRASDNVRKVVGTRPVDNYSRGSAIPWFYVVRLGPISIATCPLSILVCWILRCPGLDDRELLLVMRAAGIPLSGHSDSLCRENGVLLARCIDNGKPNQYLLDNIANLLDPNQTDVFLKPLALVTVSRRSCWVQREMPRTVGETMPRKRPPITRITRIVFLAWLIVTAILLWQTVRRPGQSVPEQHSRPDYRLSERV